MHVVVRLYNVFNQNATTCTSNCTCTCICAHVAKYMYIRHRAELVSPDPFGGGYGMGTRLSSP